MSLFASLDGSLAQLKLAHDPDSGSAIASSFKGRWFETNYNIDLLKYNHMISDRNPNGQLKLDTQIRANGLFRYFSTEVLSYDLEARHTAHRVTNLKQLQISKRLGTRWGHTLISHNLSYNHSNSEDSKDTLDSNLSATRRWQLWRLKAEMNYLIKPNGRLQGINTSATYQKNKRLTFQTGLNYSRNEGDTFSVDNTLTWNFKPASLSITAGFNNKDRQFIGLSVSTSLAYDDTKQAFRFDKDGTSSSASVIAHSYVDENNNGQFDEDEQSLEGITFLGKNTWKKNPTDENGYTTLNGIPNLSLQSISIDERSIEDPFLKAKQAKQLIYSHAGKQTKLSFSLVPTLEIEGEVFFHRENLPLRRASKVPLKIYDEQGEIIAQTNSEYDGVFLFESILPGKYRLQVDPIYLNKHQLSMHASIEIEVLGNEGVVYIDAITLKKSD